MANSYSEVEETNSKMALPTKWEAEDAEVAAMTPEDHASEYGTAFMDGSFSVEVKEQDRWLPIANVARTMKSALPESAKIAKEAKECVQECVSEFISFITSEAGEKCQQEKRKTVNGEDILFSLNSLGFENYAQALRIYLARYRETLIRTSNPTTQGPLGPITEDPLRSDLQPSTLSNDNAYVPVLKGFPKLMPSIEDTTTSVKVPYPLAREIED